MATQDDVRRIARSLPETTEGTSGRFSVAVAGKDFAWEWLERLHPKKARVPNPEVIGVRVRSEFEKQAMIEFDPDVFFTEPHYDGYPAILVRLPKIDLDLLEKVLVDGWRCQAPRRLAGALKA
jgi:hypothetical protein